MFRTGGYLVLLHPYRESLRNDALVQTIGLLDQILGACSDPVSEVTALLGETNWRPNLVGAAAALRGELKEPPILNALWRAIERPSWASPQLAVASRHLDETFLDRAPHHIRSSDPKTAAAIAFLADLPSSIEDPEQGAEIADHWQMAMLEMWPPT